MVCHLLKETPFWKILILLVVRKSFASDVSDLMFNRRGFIIVMSINTSESCIYHYIYIRDSGEGKAHNTPPKQICPKFQIETNAFSFVISCKKWEALKGCIKYPCMWVVPLSPLNNVHVHTRLKNTLRPPRHKRISIEILSYPLDFFQKEKQANLMNFMCGFVARYLGVKTFSWI